MRTPAFAFMLPLAAILLVAGSAKANQVLVSWYGPGLYGKKMVNGAILKRNDSTVVAHKELPFGTIVAFHNEAKGCQLVTLVQDRGPHIHGRQFDVSEAAAERLCFKDEGLALLTYEILGRYKPAPYHMVDP